MYDPGGAESTKCPYWLVVTAGPHGPVGVPRVEQRLTFASSTGNPDGRPRTFPVTVPNWSSWMFPAETQQSEQLRTKVVTATYAVAEVVTVRLPGGATIQKTPERFVSPVLQIDWLP